MKYNVTKYMENYKTISIFIANWCCVFSLNCSILLDISSELWEKRAGNYGKIEQIETRNLHHGPLPACHSEKIGPEELYLILK